MSTNSFGCKYCRKDYINKKGLFEETINFGVLGKMDLEIYISAKKDDMKLKKRIPSLIMVGTSPNEADFTIISKTPIKFCPMCGRKLDDYSVMTE